MDFGLSTHLYHGDRLSRDHVQAIAKHGFSMMEVFATRTHFDYHDRTAADQVRSWAAECGLGVWSVHAPICDGFLNGVWGRSYSNASRQASVRNEAVAETIASVKAAHWLGAQVVVLHMGIPLGQPIPADDNDAAALAGTLEPVAHACHAAGLRLALEVIPNVLATADGVAGFLEGDLDLGRSGACLDVGHAHLTGGAPEAALRLGGLIITTHLHDNRGREDDHLVPFDGTIDWSATLGALAKVGYAGPLVFELPDHGNAEAVLSRASGARRRIQGILDELAAPFPFRDDV